MNNRVDVLDKGYVILHDTMGNDLTVVNAARVSYDKKNTTNELTKGDRRLINFLAREGHTSPFRHATLQFEVYAPLMVARQWWKYVTGSAHQDTFMNQWNESSRRYVTEKEEFYLPNKHEWRSAPENSKQGSGDPIKGLLGEQLTEALDNHIETGERLYNSALEGGIAPEQARLFLPAYGMYVRWYWTPSLQAVAHFLKERLENDAQREIQDYAKAVRDLSIKSYPVTLESLLKY